MRISIFFVLLLPLIGGCGQGAGLTVKKNALVEAFSPQSLAGDTLHFYANAQGTGTKNLPEHALKPLPDSLLSLYLSEKIIEKLSFTGSEAAHFAGARIDLDSVVTACVVHTEDNWFRKASLLLYHRADMRFYDAIDLSGYYGGESGVVYTLSWLYKTDAGLSLFRRDIAVNFVPDRAEGSEDITGMREEKTTHNALALWYKDRFVPSQMKDSIRTCAAFLHEETW